MRTLARQTYQDFEIIVSQDPELRGAPWARNRGAELARGEYLLFSDDDIAWEPFALQRLKATLDAAPCASYCWGPYKIEHRINSLRQFDPRTLREKNYINTMALIRRRDHPGWDESLKRLQDWDYFLTLLERGKVGVLCRQVIFTTSVRNGITYGGQGWHEAERTVKLKHNLIRPR